MKKYLSLILLLISSIILAQAPVKEKLTTFVEGRGIDFNYIRNNISFVDFVNDSKIADVHVIISRKSTGGGGTEYTLSYYGNKSTKIGDLTLSCFTYSFDTEMQRREKLTASLKAGLIPFLNEKGNISVVSIKSDIISENKSNEEASEAIDKWKNWVFRIGLQGGFSGEEQKKNYNYSMDLRIRKITEQWKLESMYRYNKRESKITNIEDDIEEIIKSLRLTKNAEIKYIYSLSDNWSAGIFANGSQSTYMNNKMALSLIPALQYNFFPWAEIDRRAFTITYKVGPSYNEYYETTILAMDNEWLWAQSIDIRLEQVETWGDIEINLEGGHFFPNFENYYYEAGFDIAFRISKGLSFTFEIEAQSIHNQRYLPESELSVEDLLLNNRKPPTEFEYSGEIGIRWQFGSIYNNVVNQRLSRNRYY